MSQLPQDPKNHKPLYDQLRELILNKIVNGEYAVLSQIPSENEFAEQFGVSRMALLHKDLKCKAPLIEPNLRRNLDKW
ncbi:GntR family transcriptional regulator, partial [Acinetobacter baumannii]